MVAWRPSLTELMCGSPVCKEPEGLTLAVSAAVWTGPKGDRPPAPAFQGPCYDTSLDTLNSTLRSQSPRMDDAIGDRPVRAGAVLAASRACPIPPAGHPRPDAGHSRFAF